MATPAERLISTAEAEIGYLEKRSNSQLDDKTANAGSKNYTKYARDLDAMGVYNTKKQGFAWCDIFADWCYITTFGLSVAMKMTFQSMGGYGAGCTESARYYKTAGRFYKSDPQPGDQIFYTKDGGKTCYHTGIVKKVAGGKVYTIEGNTSSAAGVVENGGCVWAKSYDLDYNRIAGYGRPDWSMVSSTETEIDNEEDDDDMTQEKFDEMMENWLDRQAKEDPSDWSAEERQWAEEIGLIKGDEKGNKMYKSFTTREMLVVFLRRLVNLIK